MDEVQPAARIGRVQRRRSRPLHFPRNVAMKVLEEELPTSTASLDFENFTLL